MNIKNKFLILFLSLFFSANTTSASFLWSLQEGIFLYQKNDIKNAINFFKTYEKYNPNDKMVYFWLGKAYSKTQENLSKENLKKFYELYSKEKNIEKISYEPINNEKIEDYFDMAIMYFEDGNFFEANYYADLILKINPKSSSAYFIKAKLAQLEKKENVAKTYLNKAIVLNNEILRTNLAKSLNIYSLPELTKEMYLTFAQEAYFYLDMENAVRNAKKYLELDKTNPNIYALLIEAYLNSGNIQEAKNILYDAQKQFYNNLQLKLLEAKICDIELNFEKKGSVLQKAYEINPNNKQVLLELSNFYIQKKDYPRALKYSKTLVAVDDMMYEGYFNLIYCAIKSGDIDFALLNVRKLSELNKNQSELNYLLALICQYQGDFKNSKGYLNQALKDDKNSQYFLDLAKIEYLENDFSNCEKHLLEGLKYAYSTENRKEIEDNLIKVYLKTKNTKLAQNYLSRKISLDKNRLLYKYNLYVLCNLKVESSFKIKLKQITKTKPETYQDCLDLSEIYFEENNLYEAVKTLNKAIKKYPQTGELYLQKIKFYYLEKNEECVKKTITEMKKVNSPQG